MVSSRHALYYSISLGALAAIYSTIDLSLSYFEGLRGPLNGLIGGACAGPVAASLMGSPSKCFLYQLEQYYHYIIAIIELLFLLFIVYCLLYLYSDEQFFENGGTAGCSDWAIHWDNATAQCVVRSYKSGGGRAAISRRSEEEATTLLKLYIYIYIYLEIDSRL